MWVFAYGSLMSEEWDKDLGCIRRGKAQLRGYRRAFNKKSVRNWGTRQSPCPTLNVVASPNLSCWGIAYQFPDNRKLGVQAYLEDREGKDFVFEALQIELDDGSEVEQSSRYTKAATLSQLKMRILRRWCSMLAGQKVLVANTCTTLPLDCNN
jgi:cation transport regulator ChaC